MRVVASLYICVRNQEKKYLRVIRLLAGAVFAGYGIYASDSLIIILGGLLMLMAVVNWSCCAAGGCGTSSENKALYKDFVKPYRAENK